MDVKVPAEGAAGGCGAGYFAGACAAGPGVGGVFGTAMHTPRTCFWNPPGTMTRRLAVSH